LQDFTFAKQQARVQSNLPLIPPEGPQVTWSKITLVAKYKTIGQSKRFLMNLMRLMRLLSHRA
jgi:hypothetical protein